jgi:hypothetical protein
MKVNSIEETLSVLGFQGDFLISNNLDLSFECMKDFDSFPICSLS